MHVLEVFAALADEYVPALHKIQLWDPMVSEYEPEEHMLHAAALPSLE